jgi:hypothetical protein
MDKQNELRPDNIESKTIGENSPMINERMIEHKIHIEDENQKNKIDTCCGTVSDRRLLTFIATFSISLVVLLFSFIKLLYAVSCEETNVYVGLVSVIVGFYIKSPLSE